MVEMSYEDIYRLIDEDYLEKSVENLIGLNEYIPYLLVRVMQEIPIDPEIYSQWNLSIRKDNNNYLWKYYITQKSARQTLAHVGVNGKNVGMLPQLLELFTFLCIHSEFEGIIKDWEYLDKLVNECEKEYNINVLDYTDDYTDLWKLIKRDD